MKLEDCEKQLEGLSTVSSEVISKYPGLSYKGTHQAPSYGSCSKEEESIRKPLNSNKDSQLNEGLSQLGQGKLF